VIIFPVNLKIYEVGNEVLRSVGNIPDPVFPLLKAYLLAPPRRMRLLKFDEGKFIDLWGLDIVTKEIQAYSQIFGKKIQIYVGFVDGRFPNAHALVFQGCHIILLSVQLCNSVQNFYRNMLSISTPFDEVLFGRDASKLINKYGTFPPFAEMLHTAPAIDEWRRAGIRFAVLDTLRFALLHELAHLKNGHVLFSLNPGATSAMMDEYSDGDAVNIADVDLVSHACEFDADGFAFSHLLQLQMTRADHGLIQACKHPQLTLRSCLAPAVLFFIWTMRTFRSYNSMSMKHPPAVDRIYSVAASGANTVAVLNRRLLRRETLDHILFLSDTLSYAFIFVLAFVQKACGADRWAFETIWENTVKPLQSRREGAYLNAVAAKWRDIQPIMRDLSLGGLVPHVLPFDDDEHSGPQFQAFGPVDPKEWRTTVKRPRR
jgi:hypothetical protein